MTVYGPAKCGACDDVVGVAHPMFSAIRREGYDWLPFRGCPICGALRCVECAAEPGCSDCGDAWLIDEFPPVLLNRSSFRSHCRACGIITRRAGGRWYACLSCAAAFCEACSAARKNRCSCRETVVFRGVPPGKAYLDPAMKRRHAKLSKPEQIDDMLTTWGKTVTAYNEGAITGAEADGLCRILEHALRDEGVFVDRPAELFPLYADVCKES